LLPAPSADGRWGAFCAAEPNIAQVRGAGAWPARDHR
jgi:hypothetical protein